MGTIYKYVQEQASILDKNYVPIKARVYNNETEQINENVSYLVLKAFSAYNQNTVFCNNKSIQQGCSYYVNYFIEDIVFPQKTKPIIFSGNKFLLQNFGISKNEGKCTEGKAKVFTDKLLWLVYNNSQNTFWENATTFFYFNPSVYNKIIIDYCLISSYNEDVEILELNSLFGIEFEDIEVGDVIPAGGKLCFKLVVDVNSLYQFVDGWWVGIKVSVGGKEFYIKYQIYLKRMPMANSFVLYPDKNTYSETYFFNTLLFKSINGVETSYLTMENPKINFNASFTSLELYKHKFLENVNILTERFLNYFPLWSEATKTIIKTGRTSIIKVEKIPKTLEFNKVFLIEDETKAYILDVKNIIPPNMIEIDGLILYEKGQIVVPAIEVMKKSNSSIDRDNNDNNYNVLLSSVNPIKGLI